MQPAGDASTERVGMIIGAARRERGLTVEGVSEVTRIRATLIRHIEEDDFSICGGAVYARGHIRSIARALDIDPAPLVAMYERDHEQASAPPGVPQPPSEFDPIPPRGERARGGGGFNWMPAMIGSLLVVCVVAVIALLVPDSSGTDRGLAAGAGNAASPSGAGGAPGAPASASTPPTPVPTTMYVRVEARDAASWLEVRDDREVFVQQLLQQGQERTITTERPLSIRMGDAGAVGLSCNGRDVAIPGGRGDVVTVTLMLEASGNCVTGLPSGGGVAAAPPPSR